MIFSFTDNPSSKTTTTYNRMDRFIEIKTDGGIFCIPYDTCSETIIGTCVPKSDFHINDDTPPVFFGSTPPPGLISVLNVMHHEQVREAYITYDLTSTTLSITDEELSKVDRGELIDGRKILDAYGFLECVVLQRGNRLLDGLSYDDREEHAESCGAEGETSSWYCTYFEHEDSIISPENAKHLVWFMRKLMQVVGVEKLIEINPVEIVERFFELEGDELEGGRIVIRF